MQKSTVTHFSIPRVIYVNRLFYPHTEAENYHADVNNEVIHIVDGRVKLRFQSGQEYEGKKNDTFFIPHDTCHRDIFDSSQVLEAFHIIFSWDLADTLFSAAQPDCVKNFPNHVKTEINMLFDMMRTEKYPKETILTQVRLAHLLGLVWEQVFNPEKSSVKTDSFSRIVSYAKDYMAANLSQNINIDNVAAHLRVSRSTLIRAFRKSSELSFSEFLVSIRMKHAQVLLREKSLNLADCAAQCGFSDPSYFSKVFKKYFGFSPKNCH